MITIQGTCNTAVCYCETLDAATEQQIRSVCDQSAFQSSKIRIMPDVHLGKGCTIGTTMTIHDKVVPGMVGVDIGCGMETVRIQEAIIDFGKLDSLIHTKIPSGQKVRNSSHSLCGEIDFQKLRCLKHVVVNRAKLSIGSLGGGNHFIEVDRGSNGALYIVIHSGSRHIGNEVAKHYQEEGAKALRGNQRVREEAIARLKKEGRVQEIQAFLEKDTKQADIPKELAYVQGSLFDDYIHDMKIIQRFAELNRKAMMDVIVQGMGLSVAQSFTTIHNYIDTENMILRKGAVSAQAGEKLLIPINMRDGSLICTGKGNKEWNCSAPHGAGRLLSRSEAQKRLDMEEYKREMQGIYTTCVSHGTLDESPMAYKPMEDILKQIGPTVEIIDTIKPVYNFKAAE